jgi:deoxyribose-phosphate aldolase
VIRSKTDLSLLRPDSAQSDITALCATAAEQHVYGLCIPPCYVALASRLVQHAGVRVSTVVDYPYGYSPTEVKLAAAGQAIQAGAVELDVVLNICLLKSGNLDYLGAEIAALRTLSTRHGAVLKVIIEAALLSEQELEQICTLAAHHQADYVKNSTGLLGGHATPELIRKIRGYLPSTVRIKASGGIRTPQQAHALLQAGADRLGTSILLPDSPCL